MHLNYIYANINFMFNMYKVEANEVNDCFKFKIFELWINQLTLALVWVCE